MRFIVSEVLSTGDDSRFGITGYITSSNDSEKDLMESIVTAQTIILGYDRTKRNVIKVMKDRLKYCKVGIDSLKQVFDVYESSFNVKMELELGKNIVFIPASCEPIAKMELRRLVT